MFPKNVATTEGTKVDLASLEPRTKHLYTVCVYGQWRTWVDEGAENTGEGLMSMKMGEARAVQAGRGAEEYHLLCWPRIKRGNRRKPRANAKDENYTRGVGSESVARRAIYEGTTLLLFIYIYLLLLLLLLALLLLETFSSNIYYTSCFIISIMLATRQGVVLL